MAIEETEIPQFCIVCKNPIIAPDPTNLVCKNPQCLSPGLLLFYKDIWEATKKIANELAIETENISDLFDLFLFIQSSIQDVIRILNGVAEDLDLEVVENPIDVITAIAEKISSTKQK